MKVLVIGVDNSILKEGSVSANRAKEYGEMVDEYLIVVPDKEKKKIILSDKVGVYGSGGKAKPFQFVQIFKTCERLIKEKKVEVISLQDPFELALIGYFLAKKYNIGLNVQEHGDVFTYKFWRNENPRNFIRYYLGIYILKRADSIRAVSQKIKNNLVNQFGIDLNKIITFSVYTDREITLKKCKVEKPDKAFTFFWLGRFVKQKNLPLMVRAFSNVLEAMPNARLRLVGRGPEKKKIIDLIYNLRIDENVDVRDWVDDMWCEFTKADCFVLSSNYEGWGQTVIEAAISNMPIVMTDVGCASEVIENEKSGLVVPIGEQEKLQEAMIRIAGDKDLSLKLTEAAEKSVAGQPSKEDLLKLYKKSWDIAVHNKTPFNKGG